MRALRHVSSIIASFSLLTACSSSPSSTANDTASDGGDEGMEPGAEASTGATVTEHGIVYDYGTLLANGTLAPVKGLTVTDGNQTTTTDAQGNWSLTLPMGATLAPVVNGTVQGDPYSNLMLPQATATSADVDRGNIIIPDQSTFSLERISLGSTDTDAVVHVVAATTGACTSVAGGTLTVTSPSGAKVNYFNAQGYPVASQTSMVDPPVPQRPVADIYDVPPGSPITLTVTHPTCALAPYPVTVTGGSFDGQVATKAAEPGDNNSALVILLQ
jgi:hypothetical protein